LKRFVGDAHGYVHGIRVRMPSRSVSS
jgi:hypothetical protein